MDKKAGFFSDLKGGKNGSVLCFRATMSTSSGIWLGEHPLEFSFPLLLGQLSIIFLACYLVHLLLRRIGLPKVISHTISKILCSHEERNREKDSYMGTIMEREGDRRKCVLLMKQRGKRE